MKFRYRFSEKEVEDAVWCIEWKKQKKFHGIHLWITSIFGVCVLIEYIRCPEKFYLAFMLVVVIALLAYLVYAPLVSRKRKIKDLIKANGEYQLEIKSDYIISGDNGEKIALKEKEIRMIYTELVAVVRIEKNWFAIPRRLMNEEQENKFKEILKNHHCQFTELLIENERKGDKI